MKTDDVRAGLADDVSRGTRVKNFLRSEVWLKDIEPWLEEEQGKAKNGKHWSPSSRMTLEQFGLSSAYLSGADDQLQRIAIHLSDLEKMGEEAEKALARMPEKS